ncbi:MAG TPA: 2Fe-2S iron-sulfur cluster-binding protein [Myxococcota bacterium]
MSRTFDFEGRAVAIHDGDTLASALYRAGVRTFNRSHKSHRRRGLYCMTGDCPNCLVSVDGMPAVRSCCTPARAGMAVRRETGRPSAELDLLAVNDRLHALMPVGFYYKTFIKPRLFWPLAEKLIRRATGLGTLPVDRKPQPKPARHLHPDALVIGGGVAGLAAARAAAARGDSVVLCDEHAIGDKVAPGPTRERIEALAAELRAHARVRVFERAVAVGVYEGGLVPVAAEDELLQVHPGRIIVATGAAEAHAVFDGSDVPGVFLARGAARLAGLHGVAPGRRAVALAATREGIEHLATLREAGVQIPVAIVPEGLAASVPAGIEVLANAEPVRVRGRKQVRSVQVRTAAGETRSIPCDAVVAALGLSPRDGLLRMAAELPLETAAVGAGDVIDPGCSLEAAEAGGERAGRGDADAAASAPSEALPDVPARGYVCLCEDVRTEDLEKAFAEGFRSSQILKRYTTATMGPCQGALCGRLLSAFVQKHGGSPLQKARTTARPPARTVTLESLAGAAHEVVEKRTALHERHIAMGAKLARSGAWLRPYNYGDWKAEYRAVREAVSVMDVSTLGKLLVGGADATALLDRIYPCRIDDLAPGRSRYVLTLGEAGYVFDDGLVCALRDGRYFLTTTSGNASGAEAWLRDWADRWKLHVHIADQTAALGAILVAGPRARDLLAALCDDALDRERFPYMAHREIRVAGVACRALRVGFVGELAYELHHPRSRSVELWDALLAAGEPLGIRPHGLDALELLRLEKGHIYVGQDTLPDSTPAKLGMGWAVEPGKATFLGKPALERMAALPIERRLVGIAFERGAPAPEPGAPLFDGERIIGRLTSCMASPSVGCAIALAWAYAQSGVFPNAFEARLASGATVRGAVVPTPFYDPKGERLRA